MATVDLGDLTPKEEVSASGVNDLGDLSDTPQAKAPEKRPRSTFDKITGALEQTGRGARAAIRTLAFAGAPLMSEKTKDRLARGIEADREEIAKIGRENEADTGVVGRIGLGALKALPMMATGGVGLALSTADALTGGAYQRAEEGVSTKGKLLGGAKDLATMALLGKVGAAGPVKGALANVGLGTASRAADVPLLAATGDDWKSAAGNILNPEAIGSDIAGGVQSGAHMKYGGVTTPAVKATAKMALKAVTNPEQALQLYRSAMKPTSKAGKQAEVAAAITRGLDEGAVINRKGTGL
ncbi:MAG: hypothetical protein ACRCWC_14365, partial [Plesiomonas shigelloides]